MGDGMEEGRLVMALIRAGVLLSLELDRFLSTFPRRPEGLALLVERGGRAAVQEEIRTVLYAMR